MQQQIQDSLYARTRWGGRARFTLGAQEQLEAGWEQERVVQERGELERAEIQSTLFALERNALDEPQAPRRGTRTRLEATQSFKREVLRPAGERSARSLGGPAARRVAPAARARGGAEPGAGGRGAGSARSACCRSTSATRWVGRRACGATTRRPSASTATRCRAWSGAGSWGPPGSARSCSGITPRWAPGSRSRQGGDRLEVVERDGLGFGLRLETAGGLVGVDYGLEPGRPPLEGKIHLQLVSTF